jgi:hypothetical protein
VIINPDSLRNFRCALPPELVGADTFQTPYVFQSDIPCSNDVGDYSESAKVYNDIYVVKFNFSAVQLALLGNMTVLTCDSFPAGNVYFGFMIISEVIQLDI